MDDEEAQCDIESLEEPFRTIISAAILAPSGDNTQGWDFGIDRQRNSLEIFRNDWRDTSPMNAGQRMTSIACGACAENVLRTCAAAGWGTEIEYSNSPSIRISFDCDRSRRLEVPKVVRDRHTNRKIYNGRRIGAGELKLLESRIEVPDGIELRFITDAAAIKKCALVIGAADAQMFGQRHFLRAFLDNVRFDCAADTPVRYGLSIGSLELNFFERHLLRYLRCLPEAVTKSVPIRRAFRSKANMLAESASGLCTIHAPSAAPEMELKVGQVMQRAWLALTELGFRAQPMMSLPVLLGHAYFASKATNDLHTKVVDSVASMCAAVFGRNANEHGPCAILRFGEATVTTERNRRLREISTRQLSHVTRPAKLHA